jgi:hypothetical protein
MLGGLRHDYAMKARSLIRGRADGKSGHSRGLLPSTSKFRATGPNRLEEVFRSIFVAGATGQVGSLVARDLLTAGHKVRAILRNVEKANHPGKQHSAPGLAIDCPGEVQNGAGVVLGEGP